MRIAVVTGASSGLGEAFVRRIDREEPHIDQIWLIARRKERLNEIAGTLAKDTRILALDLTKEADVFELKAAFAAEESLTIGLFVGAAGTGKIGNYAALSEKESLSMIDINCRAAVAVTLCVLPFMKAGDRVIEICSTSAYQPIQHMNIYAASKAFLYNYTRGLRMELLPRGIVVTAVCPWWIKDTEFIKNARENGREIDTTKAVRGFPVSTTKETVARRALRASRHCRAVCTPDFMSFLHRIFAKILPRKVMLYIWELFRRIG